jgi:hypothetical protein
LSDEVLADLQRVLQSDPDSGSVMPGCGGLRKIRVADPKRGKGKRGGIRVIYLHIVEFDQIHLVAIYGKNQKDDLSAADRNSYRLLVRILKDQARRTGKA